MKLMENKQTAIEWLEENLIGNPHFESDFIHNRNTFKQAKAMEKEQIEKAYLEASKQTCWSYGEEPPSDDNMYAEDYYNKTYVNAE